MADYKAYQTWKQTLADAYAFIRAQETSRSLAALTLDHLIQEQIDLIQGGDSRAFLSADGLPSSALGSRSSKLQMLDSIENNLNDFIASFKASESM